MAAIEFLVDENVPTTVGTFLESRGHLVYSVGDTFAKSSPDPLLLAAAELNGLVVVTFDRDFKRLIQQLPTGIRGRAHRQAGRLSFTCKEPEVLDRITELIELIEFTYAFAVGRGQRFVMQISATSHTVVS